MEAVPREEQDWRVLYPPAITTITFLKIVTKDTDYERFSPKQRLPFKSDDDPTGWKARIQQISSQSFAKKQVQKLSGVDCSQLITMPLKRGRGRPRKNPLSPNTIPNLDMENYGVNLHNNSYIRHVPLSIFELESSVEYDMDEQDIKWVTALNNERLMANMDIVSEGLFEYIIDRLEKGWYRLTRPLYRWQAYTSLEEAPLEEQACEICGECDTQNENVIVLCDGCDLAVHQECYGVPHVPEGPWLCRKCLLASGLMGGSSGSSLSLSGSYSSTSPSCALCPWPGGALKQTTDRQWCHLVCTHWIPPSEVHILNIIYREPIDISYISKSRWTLKCSLCRTTELGAPVQCSEKSCSIAFHVLCARHAGLSMDYKNREIFCWKHRPITALPKSHKQNVDVVEVDSVPKKGATPPLIKIEDISKHHVPRSSRHRLPTIAPLFLIDQIISEINVDRELAYRIARYWSLKREARRSTPLLRRLANESFSYLSSTASSFTQIKDIIYQQLIIKLYLYHDLNELKTICELLKLRSKKELAKLETIYELLDLIHHNRLKNR